MVMVILYIMNCLSLIIFFTFQHQMLPGMQGFLKKEKLFLAPLVICIVSGQ